MLALLNETDYNIILFVHTHTHTHRSLIDDAETNELAQANGTPNEQLTDDNLSDGGGGGGGSGASSDVDGSNNNEHFNKR